MSYKHIVFPFFIFCIFILTSCGPDENFEFIEETIKTLKNEYAPDRRTARFDIELNKVGEEYVLSGQTTSIQAKEGLLKQLDAKGLTYKDRISTYPDSTVSQTRAIVHLSVCNIRSNPKHSAELATQELMGTELTILSKKDEWYLVQTPNKYISWVDHGGIVRLTDGQLKRWRESAKRIYMQPSGWVYEKADLSSDIISDIVAGCTVIDKGNKVGFFAEVELPDGRSGFIQENNSLVVEAGNNSDLVNTAKKFLGVPYLWGGTSAKGFDCSGYTKSIFAYHGYLLPRDASQQVHAGKLIDTDKTWKNLIPGDLLFFGKYRDDGSERITHVAMYMGDGKIIHAAGRVKIESLNPDDSDFAKDRYETFMKAKRMVEDGAALTGISKI